MTERLLAGFVRTDDRLRSCEAKEVFPTLEDAERWAHALSREKGETIEAYECRYCQGAHVGHALSARRIRERMGQAGAS